MDDTWITDEEFARNLDAMIGEKLYTHDQKKMVQKVNMGKEPDSKLSAIRKEMFGFYMHFANSLKNIFGYVSYKNF